MKTDVLQMDLSPKQHKAISALLIAPTIKEAAELAAVAERTLHTYLGDLTFQAAYRAARREAVRQAVARLQRASAQAVGVLEAVMNDKAARNADRIAAASKILDVSIKAVEIEDLESRIVTLEAMYAAQKH